MLLTVDYSIRYNGNSTFHVTIDCLCDLHHPREPWPLTLTAWMYPPQKRPPNIKIDPFDPNISPIVELHITTHACQISIAKALRNRSNAPESWVRMTTGLHRPEKSWKEQYRLEKAQSKANRYFL